MVFFPIFHVIFGTNFVKTSEIISSCSGLCFEYSFTPRELISWPLVTLNNQQTSMIPHWSFLVMFKHWLKIHKIFDFYLHKSSNLGSFTFWHFLFSRTNGHFHFPILQETYRGSVTDFLPYTMWWYAIITHLRSVHTYLEDSVKQLVVTLTLRLLLFNNKHF